jgi:hypothetical protein
MADVITRFKLETTQYESALRDATKWLKDVVHQTELAGNDFKEFSNRAIEAARALGQQATGATNAKDKVKELVSSYNEMAKTYNLMSDAMKKSEGGKALSASLQQLQQRINDAKAEMNATPGVLDKLASKFTVNVDAIKLFNIGLQAAEAALQVAKDAFFNNEEQLDEWGRTVQASDSLYQGFLNALNTGDISGYLSNIGNIVQAAREAYDALDALGTYNAFNQINIERTRTNMTESIADFRGGKGTKEGVKAAGDAYKKELADRQRLENEAYIAAVKEMAAKRGTNAKDLMDALSGTYGHYQDLKNVQPTGVRQTVVGSGMFARTGTETFAQNRQEKLGEALRHLNDTELQSLQALGAQAQRTGTEIAQVDKQLTRVLNGKQGGTTTTTKGSKTVQTELQKNQAKINTLTQEYVKLGDESTESSRQRQAEIQREIQLLKERNGLLGLRAEQAQGRLTLKTSDFAFGGASGDGLLANPFASDDKSMNIKGSLGLQLDPSVLAEAQKDADSYIDQLVKGAKQTEKAWGMAGQAVQGIGSAFAMIDDPAAKVAGTVMQAIASVALGFAMASKSADTVASGWGWLAWLGAGATAMATTIATIHSLTGYASGGVIKGNSYSGDNIMGMVDGGGLVGLNAGEIVLNKAQTANVANELTNNQPRAMRVNGRISGHDIVLAADRSLAQEGKGHIVTWK